MKLPFLLGGLTVLVLAVPEANAQCNRKAKFTTSDINDKFGRGLACGPDFVAASAPNDSTFLSQAGALFVYRDIGGTWQQEQMIQPSTLNQDDLFGFSVAATNGLVAASALYDDTQGVDSGAVYVFRKETGGWVLEQKLTNPVPGDQLNYGRAIAMTGDVLAVARWGPPAVVFVYRRSGTTWSLEATLTPSFADQRYGTDVAVATNLIVVGDPHYGIQEGAAEVYRYTAGVGWQSEFVAFGAVGSLLGESVDAYRDRMVAGGSEINVGGTGHAEVYKYTAGTGTWAHEQTLIGSDSAAGDGLGFNVSIASSGIYAAAPGHDAIATNAGAVYAFTFNGTSWVQAMKKAPTFLVAFDNFGTTMDATVGLLGVANRYQVPSPPDPKAVYVFEDCP
jgi:hypothetical protein